MLRIGKKLRPVLTLVFLVIGAVVVILDRELVWGFLLALWVAVFFNALQDLMPMHDGLAVEREAMSPTDLPPNAKIPIPLRPGKEKSQKR